MPENNIYYIAKKYQLPVQIISLFGEWSRAKTTHGVIAIVRRSLHGLNQEQLPMLATQLIKNIRIYVDSDDFWHPNKYRYYSGWYGTKRELTDESRLLNKLLQQLEQEQLQQTMKAQINSKQHTITQPYNKSELEPLSTLSRSLLTTSGRGQQQGKDQYWVILLLLLQRFMTVYAQSQAADPGIASHDENIFSPDNATPLSLATTEANVDLSRLLLVACAKSNIELVQELFRRNVDVNYQDVNGATCLHAAVEYNLPIVQELIDRGADVTLMVEEMTAYQLARMQYNDEIQRIILKPIMGKDTDKLIELTRLFDHKIIKDVDERIAKLLSVLSPYFERSRLIGDILGAYYYVKAQETSGSSSKQAFQLGLKYSLPRKSSYLAYLSIYPEIEVAEQALVNFPGDANLLLIKANILLQQKKYNESVEVGKQLPLNHRNALHIKILHQADIHFKQKDDNTAFNIALSLEQYPISYVWLVNRYIDLGEYKKAREICTAAEAFFVDREAREAIKLAREQVEFFTDERNALVYVINNPGAQTSHPKKDWPLFYRDIYASNLYSEEERFEFYPRRKNFQKTDIPTEVPGVNNHAGRVQYIRRVIDSLPADDPYYNDHFKYYYYQLGKDYLALDMRKEAKEAYRIADQLPGYVQYAPIENFSIYSWKDYLYFAGCFLLFMLTFGNVGYAGYHTYQLHQKMKKVKLEKERKVQAILTLLNSLTSQFYDASWQYIPDGEFRLSGTSKQQVTVDSLQVYSIDTKVLGIEVENAIKKIFKSCKPTIEFGNDNISVVMNEIRQINQPKIENIREAIIRKIKESSNEANVGKLIKRYDELSPKIALLQSRINSINTQFANLENNQTILIQKIAVEASLSSIKEADEEFANVHKLANETLQYYNRLVETKTKTNDELDAKIEGLVSLKSAINQDKPDAQEIENLVKSLEAVESLLSSTEKYLGEYLSNWEARFSKFSTAKVEMEERKRQHRLQQKEDEAAAAEGQQSPKKAPPPQAKVGTKPGFKSTYQTLPHSLVSDDNTISKPTINPYAGMIKLNPKIHMANVMLQCVAQLLKGIDDGNWDFSKPNHVLMVQYTLSYYIIKLMGALADCCADIELSEINSKVIAQAQAQMVRRGLLYHDYNGLDFLANLIIFARQLVDSLANTLQVLKTQGLFLDEAELLDFSSNFFMKDLEQSISTNPLIFNYSIYCVEKLQLYVNFLVRLANRNSEICQENIDEKSLLEVYRAIVLSIYDIRHGIHRRHKKQLVDFLERLKNVTKISETITILNDVQKFIATIRGKDKLGNDSVFVEKYTDEQIVDHLEKEMNCIKMIADHRGRSSYINGFSEDLGENVVTRGIVNKVIDYNMKKLLRYVQEFQLLWLEYGKLPLQEFSNNQELLVCLKMLVMLIGQQIRSFPEAIRKEIATTCVIPCGLAENTKTSFEQYRANLHHYGTNNEPYEEVSFVELTKIAKKMHQFMARLQAYVGRNSHIFTESLEEPALQNDNAEQPKGLNA